ncbi:MAG: 2-oxo acid dehydrogenase subunit E2 [Deltaproteobacteria bacterium]|nr:2-oxo acid dehydrogenase subunit E2 [Deltaproteobacteria bacterium]
MRTEVRLPALGENIESADVGALRVAVGDRVVVDQGLFEVEADKATVEVPAPVAGLIVELAVQAGAPVRPGQVVVVIETEPVGSLAASVTPKESATSAESMSRTEAAPAASTGAGFIEATQVVPSAKGVDASPPMSAVAAPGLAEAEAASGVARSVAPVKAARGFASPSVRRLARELGVDVSMIESPRVTEDDVKLAARARSATVPERPFPDLAKFGPVEREPMSKVRRATADAMSYAWRTIPHVTLFHEAEVTALEAARERHAKRFEADGTKLTVTAMLLKVVASALRVFPKLNASVDLATYEVVWRRSIHLGVAVDTPRGLLVPVLRDADQKGVRSLARELGELAAKARSSKLTLDEMSGATFSVTNLGGLGTGFFTPIINPPEVAILGVGRATKRDGSSWMPLSLSFDHRVVDGADGARFMSWVTNACADPYAIWMD